MSNKRITDLTELTNPTTDDVFPVVDIASNTTTKVQLGNLPIPTAVTTALATKQDTLVSGTNIKTVNSTSLVGSGNVAVQETLVSGTNIKTLNSTSLLGSGNIVLTANPSGVAGAIQFSNGSAFASDAANLFWDDTNNRLGVGTNAPTQTLDVNGSAIFSSSVTSLSSFRAHILQANNNASNGRVALQTWDNMIVNVEDGGVGIAKGVYLTPSAQVHIKGNGSTSATTSLLVQNSAGTAALTVRDDLSVLISAGGIFGFGDTTNYAKKSGAIDGVEIAGYGGVGLGAFGGINTFVVHSGSASLGATTANASAIFDITSTTKGFLPPRMTTTQKNAIASPATGLVLYDTTTNKLQCYNGSTWNDLF